MLPPCSVIGPLERLGSCEFHSEAWRTECSAPTRTIRVVRFRRAPAQSFDRASPTLMLPPVRIVNVLPGSRSYRIKIGPVLLARLGQECADLQLDTRCAIISDAN